MSNIASQQVAFRYNVIMRARTMKYIEDCPCTEIKTIDDLHKVMSSNMHIGSNFSKKELAHPVVYNYVILAIQLARLYSDTSIIDISDILCNLSGPDLCILLTSICNADNIPSDSNVSDALKIALVSLDVAKVTKKRLREDDDIIDCVSKRTRIVKVNRTIKAIRRLSPATSKMEAESGFNLY